MTRVLVPALFALWKGGSGAVFNQLWLTLFEGLGYNKWILYFGGL
jgi:hypothetical protein